jgi:predicted amidophosphoribosyltransferase
MIRDVHVRVCPECDEEFRPEIVTCSDCGATLVDHWEGEEGEGGVEAPAPPVSAAFRVPADYKPVASATSADEIDPAARKLGEAGIEFAVTGQVHRFVLLVSPANVERALEVLGVGAEPAEAATTACPACGAETRGAAECPECGLGLGGEEAPDLETRKRDRFD